MTTPVPPPPPPAGPEGPPPGATGPVPPPPTAENTLLVEGDLRDRDGALTEQGALVEAMQATDDGATTTETVQEPDNATDEQVDIQQVLRSIAALQPGESLDPAALQEAVRLGVLQGVNPRAAQTAMQETVALDPEQAAKDILKGLGAPKPPEGYTYRGALELVPTAEDIQPSYWDGFLKLDDLRRAGISVELARHHLGLYRQRLERDTSMDRFIEHEKYDFVERQNQRSERGADIAAWMRAFSYSYMDGLFPHGIEHLESTTIAEASKIQKETTNTGPDQNLRIIFAYQNPHGVWMDYKGAELKPQEIRIRNTLLKKMRHDLPTYQAKAAYEITKLEPQEQAELWARMVDVQLNELGYHPAEVNLVMIGLQYLNKPLYLSFKHSKLTHPLIRDGQGELVPTYRRDEHGRIIKQTVKMVQPKRKSPLLRVKGKNKGKLVPDRDPNTSTLQITEQVLTPQQAANEDGLYAMEYVYQPNGDVALDPSGKPFRQPAYEKDERGHTKIDPNTGQPIRKLDPNYKTDYGRVVWGPINIREYGNELSNKFSPYDMRFEATDVQNVEHLVKRAIEVVDTYFYDYDARNSYKLYLDNLFFLAKMHSTMRKSQVGPQAGDPSSDDPATRARNAEALATGGVGMYEPSLSTSPADADDIWKRMCKRIKAVGERVPVVAMSVPEGDNPRYSPIEPEYITPEYIT